MDADTRLLSALGVLVTLGIFFYNSRRERPRLKVTRRFYPASEWGPASVSVSVVNTGRRPVTLRMLGGCDRNGRGGGTYLEHSKGGIRLGENERYDFSLKWLDTFMTGPDDPDIPYASMWVEDSLSKRHYIPGYRRFIKKMAERGHEPA